MKILIFLIFIIGIKANEINDKIICSKGSGLVYDSQQNKMICQPCSKGFYSFGGSNKCMSCREYNNKSNPFDYYSDHIGSENCQHVKRGMYVNKDHSEVFKCNDHCEHCVGDIHLGKCLKCEPGF